jgi:ribosomal protein S12 methylthiotransferase
MRGGHVSKPLNEIISETQKLAERGVKELLIIGQDTTYWGFDINRKRELAKVLNEISKVKGIEWIRLMYAYPSRFPDGLTEIIRDNEKVCKYIDIPVQHVSDKVLKEMRRGITAKQQLNLLEKLRKEIPDIAIRTTLLTGHPGEGDAEFNELLSFVKEFRFDRLGVFTYSEEDGTHSASMKDTVSRKEKNLRQKKLLEAQRKISEENNRESLGKIFSVIIDRKEGNYYIGRTYKDAPEIDQEVYMESAKPLKTGTFHKVMMYDYEEFDLFGEVILT